MRVDRPCAGDCGRWVKTYSLCETAVYCSRCIAPVRSWPGWARTVLTLLCYAGLVLLFWAGLVLLGTSIDWN